MTAGAFDNADLCGAFRGIAAVILATVGLSVTGGPAYADSDSEGQLEFVAGKFTLPINRGDVKADWIKRGYPAPTLESYLPGWHRGDHTHPWKLLITVVTGVMEFTVEGKRFVVEPGDELSYPAGAMMTGTNVYGGTSEILTSYKW